MVFLVFMVWLPRTTFAGRSSEIIRPNPLFMDEERGSRVNPFYLKTTNKHIISDPLSNFPCLPPKEKEITGWILCRRDFIFPSSIREGLISFSSIK